MKNFVVILCISIAFGSCHSSSGKRAEAAVTDIESLTSKIDSVFESYIDSNGPGAALLVSYDGEMLIGKGYGLRDLDNNIPVTASTNLRMASVSKQFTALTLLSLVDQGLITLDDSVSSYLPYPVFEGITIQQLINHTSGLADYEEAFMEDWDRTEMVENEDILDWLQTNPSPSFAPGEQFEYSNTAYLVLALLVEKISQQEFSAYAKENVFKKAGMDRTTYYNLAKPIEIPERAYCYQKDLKDNWTQVDGFFMNGVMGDGAVYTSVKDYFEYDQALRQQSILSKELHDILFQSSITLSDEGQIRNSNQYPFLNSDTIGYAMGWFVTDHYAFHAGGWYGTSTFVLREIDRPLTIAIFLNASSSINKFVIPTYNLVNAYLSADANKNQD